MAVWQIHNIHNMPVAIIIYVHGLQQCNLSQIHFETGTHILGHCISSYKNKRGAEYCQLVQQHKAVWETACCECEPLVSQNVDRNCIMMVKMHST